MATQPHLQVEPGDVNSVALLPGDPDRVERIASRCADTVEVAENREYRVVNGTYEGVPVTICSTGIGSPSAAIAVEELANAGLVTDRDYDVVVDLRVVCNDCGRDYTVADLFEQGGCDCE